MSAYHKVGGKRALSGPPPKQVFEKGLLRPGNGIAKAERIRKHGLFRSQGKNIQPVYKESTVCRKDIPHAQVQTSPMPWGKCPAAS